MHSKARHCIEVGAQKGSFQVKQEEWADGHKPTQQFCNSWSEGGVPVFLHCQLQGLTKGYGTLKPNEPSSDDLTPLGKDPLTFFIKHRTHIS